MHLLIALIALILLIVQIEIKPRLLEIKRIKIKIIIRPKKISNLSKSKIERKKLLQIKNPTKKFKNNGRK